MWAASIFSICPRKYFLFLPHIVFSVVDTYCIFCHVFYLQATPLPPTLILDSWRVRCLEAQISAWRVRLQPEGSDCSLEAQVAAWRRRLQAGGLDCSLEGQPGDPLEPQGAIWNSTGGHLQLQVAIWSFRLPFEAPGVHLELQVNIWTSRPDLQVATWSFRWPFEAPGYHLELQVAI